MERNIIVTAKQVIDPETPASAMHVNAQGKAMETPPNVPPVINGYDENAIEAALRIPPDRQPDPVISPFRGRTAQS